MQRWVARVGNRASEPLPLDEAKRAAVAMLGERGKGEARDWIAELNQIAANEVDSAVIERERRKWPIDLMGGKQREGSISLELRREIIDTELSQAEPQPEAPLQGDDYPLEDDEDGQPKLPDCLLRVLGHD